MRYWRFTVVLMALSGLIVLFASADPRRGLQDDISKLRFMSGAWQMESGGSIQEEVWTSPSGGSLMGIMRVVRQGKTVNREFNLVEQTTDGVVMIVSHVAADMKPRDGWPVTLKMTKCAPQEAEFENQGTGGLRKVGYKKLGEDTLVAVIDVDRDGIIRHLGFTMTRAKLP